MGKRIQKKNGFWQIDGKLYPEIPNQIKINNLVLDLEVALISAGETWARVVYLLR